MPVRTRNGASSSLSSATTSSWARQPVDGETVGDGEPGRMVGQHDVGVAEVAGGPGHDVDGTAAVGPVGVGMAVALQLRPQGHRLRRRFDGLLGSGLGLQALQIGGHLAGQRFGDHRGRRLADAGQVLQPAPTRPAPPAGPAPACAAAPDARRKALTR